MRGFSELHPATVTVYFLVTMGISMFCMDPLILSLSLAGAVALFVIKGGSAKTHLFFGAVLLISAIINPLVYHNGVTVLFVMNDSPITLEALIYGVFAGVMIVAAMYWFGSFTMIMTSDRLLCILGGLSPKLSLVISMALRYVPLFSRRSKKITEAQRAVGLYKDDNVIDGFKGGLGVFSALTTWALENGIVTADSMAARGYGVGKRSHYPKFRFKTRDLIVLMTVVFLGGIVIVSMLFGAFEITFYPGIVRAEQTVFTFIGAASYALLTFLPTVIEAKEAIKWRYLTSKL